jgi:cob(I)alamin adenosyltransferase
MRSPGVKIYTKTGDKGETSLLGGARVGKDHARIDAYGTVDELNAVIGVCRSMQKDADVDTILEEIQNDLFVLGAVLAAQGAGPKGASPKGAGKVPGVQQSMIARLERHIDAISEKIQPLSQFILPGGNAAAAMLHFARTVCRRAERLTVHLGRSEPVPAECTVYLNRLSDLLFVCARWVNALTGTKETKWSSLS